MVRRNSSKIFLPVVIFFILLNAIFIAGKNFFDDKGFDKAIEEWKSAGGDKVLAEFEAQYNKK